MSFLSLWAFWFLVLVPLAVGLYLLRLKRKRHDVSSLIFWQEVLRDEQSTKLFQKLRRILSLLLQILFIVLIVLALARPVLKHLMGDPTSRILVIDTTASMQVKEGDKTRFEMARSAARRWIAQSSFKEETMILAAGREPKVVCPFSSDEKVLLEVLAALNPTDAAGSLLSALEDAKKILQGKTGVREIVVLSDQPVPGHFKEDLDKGMQLSEETFGTTRDNVGILRFASRPLLTSPDTYEILFQIKNFGSQPVQTEAEFYLNDSLVDVKPVKLAAGEMKTELYPALPAKGGRLRIVLKRSDALMVDNEAFTILPELKRQKVLLVTKSNLFLQRVLQANALVDLTVRLPSEFSAGMAKEFTVVVVDASAADLKAPVGEMANSIWLGTVPGVAPAGDLDRPVVSDVEDQNPLVRLAVMRNITLARARKYLPSDLSKAYPGWTFDDPVRSFEFPLIVSARKGDKRWVAWAFDILDTDLPLRVAFPLMISNTLQWLIPELDEIARNVDAGDIVPLAEGEQAAGGRTRFFVPEKTGFHEISTPKGSRWVAVNLFDAGESEAKGVSKEGREPSGRFFGGLVRPIWFYLVLMGATLLLLEWWLWNRRIVA